MTIRIRTILAAAGLAGVVAMGGQTAAIAQEQGSNLSQDAAKAHPGRAKPVDLGQGDLGLLRYLVPPYAVTASLPQRN